MNIGSIYAQYTIPPHLQLHMLRVAGVCKLICDHWTGETLPIHDIITVWLTHDLGNILKFDMEMFPEVRKPEWVKYRQGIKDDFAQYGDDEHAATKKIASLCGISDSSMELLKMFDEYNDDKLMQSKNSALWICDYADARVATFGITTLHDRIQKITKRNMKNHGRTEQKAKEVAKNRTKTAEMMEEGIFKQCTLTPEDINDRTINPLLEDLRSFDIVTP